MTDIQSPLFNKLICVRNYSSLHTYDKHDIHNYIYYNKVNDYKTTLSLDLYWDIIFLISIFMVVMSISWFDTHELVSIEADYQQTRWCLQWLKLLHWKSAFFISYGLYNDLVCQENLPLGWMTFLIHWFSGLSQFIWSR